MTIRRFKALHWKIDYVEHGSNPLYRRIDMDGRDIIDADGIVSLDYCENHAGIIELPCYTKDLIEGDLAVVDMGSSHGIHTVYILCRTEGNLDMLSLTEPSTYWSTTHFTSQPEVLALLSNTFDSERATYGVEQYG